MKTTSTLLILSAGLLSLTGCTLFQKTVQTETHLPSVRETLVSTNTDNDTYRSKTLDRGEISGYWAIAEVGGKKAIGEEPPYLKFDTTNRRIYGNNGCNTLNASYKANNNDSTLTFSNVATTMRACGTPDLSEVDINLALANTAYYTWAREGLAYTVTLLSATHQPLMKLIHQNYDFLNGTWTVTALGSTALDKPDIKLVFDVEEQKIHGNSGCNILNGTMIPDMLETGAITFTNMSTTRMTCPDIELETSILVALEEVTNVVPVNANTVEMFDSHGVRLLTLQRIPSES